MGPGWHRRASAAPRLPDGRLILAGAMPTRKPAKKKPSGTPRRRRGVKLTPAALGPDALAIDSLPTELGALAEAVKEDGGRVLAAYREPLGGHPLLLVALPPATIVPTPFQRDISDAHVLRLTKAM